MNKLPNILNELNYFTNQDFSKFVKEQNTNKYLYRYTKTGDIIRLKKGLYVTQKRLDDIEKNQQFDIYTKYIGTSLINPSYISTEYILAQNNIIIENVYTLTAITTRKTTKISNKLTNYNYRNIDKNLFRGYETIKMGNFVYYEASPEKALLDRLWLKKDIIINKDYIKELRLELDYINFELLEKYVKKFNKKKITKIFKILKQLKG